MVLANITLVGVLVILAIAAVTIYIIKALR